MSGNGGSVRGDQEEAVSPSAKLIKANGEAAKIPRGNPSPALGEGSEGPSAGKTPPASGIPKAPETSSEPANQGQPRHQSEGGKSETTGAAGEERKAKKTDGTLTQKDPPPKKKNPSDKSIPSKSESFSDTSVRKANEEDDSAVVASHKDQEFSKGRSPTDEKMVPAKPDPSPADGKTGDGGKIAQKKAQDTSKRKSPTTGEKKVPEKFESSSGTLENRKIKGSESKGAVVSSAQGNATKKKSPSEERSESSAAKAPDVKALAGAGSHAIEERTKRKSSNGEKTLSSKSGSITGPKSDEVASSAPAIAQETSKRKSQTDDISIPSAKPDETSGATDRNVKDTEKKDTASHPISKSQEPTKGKKSKEGDSSASAKLNAIAGDAGRNTTGLGSEETVGAPSQKNRDLSTKRKTSNGEKVANATKTETFPAGAARVDKESVVSPSSKTGNDPQKKSPNGGNATSSRDTKSAAPPVIVGQALKSSSQASGTDAKTATGEVMPPSAMGKTDAGPRAKRSPPHSRPSKAEDPAHKDLKAPSGEKSGAQTKGASSTPDRMNSPKSDAVGSKEKQVKATTPSTPVAPKVLGMTPKDDKAKSPESEKSPSSGVSIGGASQQREDAAKREAADSKRIESRAIGVEGLPGKDSRIHKPRSVDGKPSNGNGTGSKNGWERQEHRVKIQPGVAKERSGNNGKKTATSPVDPKKIKNGNESQIREEDRPSVQRDNGLSVISPTSSVRMDVVPSSQNGVMRTPTEHKTIVQKLQEARQEAILVRGGDRKDLRQQYSKSEMILPAAVQTIPVVSGDQGDKQVTSSPNIKVQTPTTHVAVVPAAPTAASRIAPPTGPSSKEISKSEAVLPAAERAKEKQRTSSPNLSGVVHNGRHTGSAEGLPRGSHGGPARNGPSETARDPSSRKGSIISDTTAEGVPAGGGSRARSATWSQAAPQPTRRDEAEDDESSTAPVSAASEDPDWDKRWSSAGSDVLAHRSHRSGSTRGPGGGRGGPFGKEWRSEWGSEAAWRGVAPGGRVWESEAGLLGRHHQQRGLPPGRLDIGAPGPLARKELVSPSSSSTASKGSGIERISEASSSYHSATSSTHGQRRDSVKADPRAGAEEEAAGPEEAAPEEDSGDRVKLIECGGAGPEVQMERRSGSGKRRGHHAGPGNGGGGVENRGADLDRVLQEEEEAAVARVDTSAGPAEQRSFIDIWDSEDKFSVANSQLPLTPAGDDDEAASIGSVMTAEPERGNWTGRFDFLLSLLGYSVGLGNVWRFPYLCYNNGGGAFLIPFTIMLVIAGLPLMFMELSFGQFANLGPAAIYSKFCPLFHGLGYGMVIVSTVVMLYYNLIIAWTIFYMFASLNKQLPWQNCEPEWSTLDCYSYEIADKCSETNGTYYQRTCYNESEAAANNISHLAERAEKRPPAEEYFNNYVLGLSKGIEETGEVRLSMALCLLLAWVIVFLCLSKGVQSSGKVVYFTALFPYVVLIILFIRGVTLPGASTGILFYLTPDWRRLSNAQVWGDAAVQIFFALSPAWGGLITLASYNKFSNNCYKDSLIVAVSNILTSFFAGFVIFSVIGFLAHELKVEVKKVVDQGAGLAFIVYPEVVTRLPVSPLWSLLFFVMLLTLGLDSQFALMETVTTAILDRFPNLREKKVWVVLIVAVFGYFGGLIFTTNSGMYWLQLMDKYAANWSVLLIAISECILIAWVYGAGRFLRDVQEMIGPQSRLWLFFWCWMWKLVTPAALLFILFFNWVEYAPASYGEYIYPLWADAAGWVIGVLPVMVIIIAGVVKVCTAPEGALREKLRKLLQPTPDWGPSLKRSSAPPTYDSIRNTIVLMNGLPVIQETHVESQEDNTL